MYKAEAVQTMQDYIQEHCQDEDFIAAHVCSSAGYSKRHADRLFKKYLDMTLSEYMNAVCLTKSAEELLNTEKNIVDIALGSHFGSHEGFLRSFYRRFHINPSEYRDKKTAIPLFIQYPISHYYALLKHKEELIMDKDLSFCMVTAKDRPKRKLIYLASKNAQDYFSFCEECGCEWEGLLNSIPEKLEPAALIELSAELAESGNSRIAAGIEVPENYDKDIPKAYKIAELPECTMLYFQSEPYENEEDFCTAIENTYAAVGKYDPALYGYRYAYETAPSFNFGAEAKTGARLAIPAVRIV